MFVTLDCYQ